MIKRRTLTRLSIVLLAIIVLFAAYIYRQPVSDWFRLRGYQPPAAVTKLVDDDTMNAYTRHLFYLNKPQLLPTVASFRQNCPENTDVVVLGCYHTGQNGIYIYNVADPSLAGIQQVTAAHEVLHAVYARLSSSDRKQLDTELEAYYKNGLTDPTVQAEVKLYQQTEPDSVFDEMSCTFGTEIANLPKPLEAYYARYFTNRQAIIGFENSYHAQFLSRQEQIATDDTQLGLLKQQITNQQSALASQSAQLSSERNQMQAEAANGQTAQYNNQVASYNAAVNAYNSGIDKLEQTIQAYNALVASRNAIAGQLTTLDQAIDTRVPTKA